MFELNKVYQWGSMGGTTPYVTDTQSGEKMYIEQPCSMVYNGKAVPMLRGVWEPVSDCMMKCIGTDPLMFSCAVEARLLKSKQQTEWEYVIQTALTRFGIRLSDHEKSRFVDIYRWYFEVQNKCADPDTLIAFILDQLNNNEFHQYNGSWNGATSAESNRKFLFEVLFGVDMAPILSYISDSGVEVKATVSDGRFNVTVSGFPLEDYVKNVLMIDMRKSNIGSLLRNAQG